jgi:hypothetical protein
LQAIWPINPCGGNLDQHFTGSGLRYGSTGEGELFRAAGFGDFDNGHAIRQ